MYPRAAYQSFKNPRITGILNRERIKGRKQRKRREEGKKQTKETQTYEETFISLNFTFFFQPLSNIFYAYFPIFLAHIILFRPNYIMPRTTNIVK